MQKRGIGSGPEPGAQGASGDSAEALVEALRLRLAELRGSGDSRVAAILTECDGILTGIKNELDEIAARKRR